MNKKSIYEDETLRREIRMKAANDFDEKLSEDEVSMCILTMERKRVSFFADHMWPNRRQGKLTWSLTADGRRAIAHQNGLAGMASPHFEGSGELANGRVHPLMCRVTVYRKMIYAGGQKMQICEYQGEARWEEFVGLKRSGEVNAQWKQRPFNQLAKCAEMQALRRGFPEGEIPDDTHDAIEHDDLPLNEVDSTESAPVTKSEPKPEPKPAPRPVPTIDSLKDEGLPLLKAYCDKFNGGQGMSWKAAYTKLAGVVGDKDMDVRDYETLIGCLRETLEAGRG